MRSMTSICISMIITLFWSFKISVSISPIRKASQNFGSSSNGCVVGCDVGAAGCVAGSFHEKSRGLIYVDGETQVAKSKEHKKMNRRRIHNYTEQKKDSIAQSFDYATESSQIFYPPHQRLSPVIRWQLEPHHFYTAFQQDKIYFGLFFPDHCIKTYWRNNWLGN